jgi:Ca2+-binding RTX toxin-like protein
MSNNFVMAITPSSATTSNGIITYTYTLTMDAVAPVDEPIDFVIRGVGDNPASLEELTRYQELNQTITFKPGETIKTFNVKVPAAAANQAEKTFEVKLTSSLAWVTPDPQKDSVVSLVSTTPKNGDLKFLNGQIFSTTPSASNDYIEVFGDKNIKTLAGDDKVFSSGKLNNIDTGIGNDEVVVTDGDGTIMLGSGNDTVKIMSYSGSLNMDGGKGIDTLDLSQLTNVPLLEVDEQGNINITDIVTMIVQKKFGTARGFEKIIGTDNGDFFVTGKGLTMIDGGGGNDIIISNTGNDQLDGGDGDDSLNGGRGADTLTGGKGNDMFVFSSIKDLNKAEQKIDVITDFKSGEDVLFLNFDHNSKTKLTQPGEFIGEAPFTKVAGQIRYVSRATEEGPVTFVQGDTNGDGNFDWMIKLLGVSSLTKNDFIYIL